MSMITMSCLGQMGRWGNQVLQYAFIRAYAERYHLEYQASPWAGQVLFGHNDPPVTADLPRYTERRTFTGGHNQMTDRNVQWNHTMPPDSREVDNRDFRGYAQFHTSYYFQQQGLIRSLFSSPSPAVADRITPAVNQLRAGTGTVIGLHLRRGDTGHSVFYLTPNEWYLAWLRENWKRFHKPKLFIATECPGDVEAFRDYHPITSGDLMALGSDKYDNYPYLPCDLANPTAGSMDWFPDWWLLRNCDVLAIGESTFSFSAAMANPFLQELWRSVLSRQDFLWIDPWDSYPLVREHIDDFPRIPGTFYKSNPAWGQQYT